MNHDFDVVVVGAGMVGAAVAALFAPSRVRALLIDANAREPYAPGGRVVALGRAAARILDAAGAWDGIPASPYRAMTVFDEGGGGELSFDAGDAALPQLGWIVENRAVEGALIERAAATRWQAPLERLDFESDGVIVHAGGKEVTCALVVGADGAGSRVRDLCGIEVDARGYGQRAVVATVTPSLPHRETAWQRFLRTGPVALLPLADGRCSLVWSLPDDEAERILGLPDAAFCKELSEATAFRLGDITAAGPRAAFPLSRLHAREYVKPRVALVGDAAHVVHPLAGQGVNLGLLDAAALVESVLGGVQDGQPVGAWTALRRYARWRRAHNVLMQEMLDAFHRVFGSDDRVVAALRDAGLSLVDGIGPLKRQMVAYATGEQGDLPTAARPRSGFM